MPPTRHHGGPVESTMSACYYVHCIDFLEGLMVSHTGLCWSLDFDLVTSGTCPFLIFHKSGSWKGLHFIKVGLKKFLERRSFDLHAWANRK